MKSTSKIGLVGLVGFPGVSQLPPNGASSPDTDLRCMDGRPMAKISNDIGDTVLKLQRIANLHGLHIF